MSRNVTSTVMHRRTRNPGVVDSNVYSDSILAIDNLWGWWPVNKQSGYSDSDPMGSLLDYSGNGHHSSSSGALRPTYKTNIQNSLPVFRCAGNHYFDLGMDYTFNLATYFVVWSRVNAGYNDVVLLATGGNAYAYLQYGNAWYYAGGTSATVAMAAGSFMLKCAKYDNSNVTLYTNGAQDTSPASSVDCWLRYFGAGGFLLSGDIAEIIVFNTNLSDTDRQSVENYINTKYALW